jgi:protein SSD1
MDAFITNAMATQAYHNNNVEMIIREQIEKGELFSGILNVFPKKRKVAYVKCANLSVDICIEEEGLRGRAFHGDCVAVELLPIEAWLPMGADTSDQVPEVEFKSFHIHEDEEAQQSLWQPKRFDPASLPAAGKRSSRASPRNPMDDLAKRGNLQPTGRVVYILEKLRPKRYIGTLALFSEIREGVPMQRADTKALFKPSNVRYSHMVCNKSDLPPAFVRDPYHHQNQIFSAELCEDWPTSSKMPFVRNIAALGEAGTIEVETIALLMENNLDHGDFSQEMLMPLYTMLGLTSGSQRRQSDSGWKIPQDEINRRRDLRSTRIFTIDPPTAKDLDDALHITPLPDGTFEIGYDFHFIHIPYVTDMFY